MRTTVDLPDDLYRDLKVKAAREGVTIRVLIETAVRRSVRNQPQEAARIRVPLIKGSGRRKINPTNAEIDELLA